MASHNYSPQDSPGTHPSIPLQDLQRPPGTVGPGRRRRSSSGGSAGEIHGRRTSFLNRGSRSNQYERIVEESPAPQGRLGQYPDYPGSAMARSHDSPYAPDEEQHSPIEDLGGFAQAMTSVGLSFDGPRSLTNSASAPAANLRSSNSFDYSGDGHSHYTAPDPTHDPDNNFSPTDIQMTDTTPLTDQRYLQPISGAAGEDGQQSERQGRSSVRFAAGTAAGSSHLGDDLPNLESGLGRQGRGSGSLQPGDRSRSTSPASTGAALLRAGSIMREMSQRVVNISNEPEVVEQSIRRKSSLRHAHARLEAPPVLPAMDGYAHDSIAPEPPREKRPSVTSTPSTWRRHPNPLKGRSLGIFSPENKFRKMLCELLVHPATEPFILIVIIIHTVLLAVQSAPNVFEHPPPPRWGTKMDYAFVVIFAIYTVELIVRIIVSGLIKNPHEYSTIDRSLGTRKAMADKVRGLFVPQRQFSVKKPTAQTEVQPSILRSFTGMPPPMDSNDPLQKQRVRLAQRAFLRHSFNRLDFVAVISFWVSFVLSLLEIESGHHLYLFRMLSCLRTLRLLSLTSGTSVILRSLKKAAPLLVHVAFLISFFWLLFAIVGIQAFKSSLRRTCTWVDPTGVANYTLNDASDVIQFCGGHLDNVTGQPMPWIYPSGQNGTDGHKGYLCPRGSLCIIGDNPYSGTVSFDDILHSLELVFVLMSSNTFSDLLYYLTDSDYLAAALFFACGLVVLSLWLVNLLVAVITSSFQVIREESKRSAFTTDTLTGAPEEKSGVQRVNSLKKVYNKTYWLWIVLILVDLCVQCTRSAAMSDDGRRLVTNTETVITFIFLFEILLRFAVDWRNFHKSKRNWFDLGLAVITSLIQIPPIRNSGQLYAGFTIFQILRIYRVVLAFSVTRDLIMTVFRNVVGLVNLIMFVFLITFLAAIFAAQLFRGQIPEEGNEISFFSIYNSFLGMYQMLSSENWTSMLYSATESTVSWGTAWISASFFIIWFILANFIVLNMFIAVIQESFDVSEDEKRLQQVKAFLQQKQVGGSSQGNLSLSTIFKVGRDERYKDPLDHGPAALEMLLKDAVVHEFLDEDAQPAENHQGDNAPGKGDETPAVQAGFLSRIWTKALEKVLHREPNPFYSKLQFSRGYEELDPSAMAQEVLSASEQRKRAQRDYLQKYPNYNVSLFLFSPSHPVRKFCQRIVGPGRGDNRVEGVDPYKPVWYAFSAFIYAAIVAMVLLACITTPLYQRQYFESHNFSVRNWFVWTDMGFAVVFTIEAIIKVIADGFFWTPNAYFRGSWGFIDGLVLITLWVNVITSLYKDGGISRAVGAFKALRALRLLNVSDSARNTFHSVIIVGGWKVVSAAFVSMSFLVPFAIYGLNLFNGQMKSCNDSDFGYSDLTNCVGEYSSSPFNWDVLAPRTVSNPYYDFDNFGGSLFILFQIVSQEGWTDLMWSAMSMTGVNQQPQDYASEANGLFFVVFNLLGSVFVLTLFVSVFMRNYTEQTGVAFLTAEQRSWLELRKLLRQINPSKRAVKKDSKKWKAWCYRVAVKKHGRWATCVTTILVLHLLLLVLEFYPAVPIWERIRDLLFLLFTLFYVANVILRLVGLSWHRFRRSSWDLYSLPSVFGTLVTTILALIRDSNHVLDQLHKLFLVSITLHLIPRNNQLDQLFKTAAASLPAIGNLMATWFVLFLVYAIALTQTFGLTKFGESEKANVNFRDVPRALILLFRTSVGEGWNQLMEDYATMRPPFCTDSDDFYASDCGSAAWARALFISWNILSMYIFVSLFVSLIFESFSYVYQRSSGLYAVSREDLRRFKEAWATYDPDGTGFVPKEVFPRLLGELSGIFEMRIYDGEFTVGQILEDCRVDRRESAKGLTREVHGVDLDKLNRIIDRIPVEEIRRKRQRLNIFFEEVLVSADPDFGISFTSCLMILAHYNVISDSKSLKLEEFLRRRARLQRVEEAVRRNVVVGFFDTLYWSRAFRRQIDLRKNARMTAVPQFAVPEIYIEEQAMDEERRHDETEMSLPSPMLSPSSPTMRTSMSSLSTQFSPRGLPPIDTAVAQRSRTGSNARSEWSSISPSLSPRHLSQDIDTAYHGAGPPSGASTPSRGGQPSSAVSVQDVMNSLGNSAWGESIRRSFTMRRSGQQ